MIRSLVEALSIIMLAAAAIGGIALPWPAIAKATGAWRLTRAARHVRIDPDAGRILSLPTTDRAWNAPSDPLYGGRHQRTRQVLTQLITQSGDLTRIRPHTLAMLRDRRETYLTVAAARRELAEQSGAQRAAYLYEQEHRYRELAEDLGTILAAIEPAQPAAVEPDATWMLPAYTGSTA